MNNNPKTKQEAPYQKNSVSNPRGFQDPYEQICEYLGLNYLGSSFIYSGTERDLFLKNNIYYIKKARSILEIAF